MTSLLPLAQRAVVAEAVAVAAVTVVIDVPFRSKTFGKTE
jgi:hypothetical protein